MTIDIEEFRGLTVAAVLERNVALRPDREAVVAYEEARLTYRQLDTLATSLAAGLVSLGVRSGERVALDLPNWPEFLIGYYAVAKMGAVVVPLNIRYRVQEVGHMLRHSEASALITCASFGGFDYLGMFQDLWPGLPRLRHIVAARGKPRQGVHAFEEVLDVGSRRPLPPAPARPDDVFMILYTSGTTGTPKGAMLTHSNKVIISAMQAQALECTEDDVFLAAVPLGHVFGTSATIGAAAAAGAKMVLIDAFHAERVLQAVERERITIHHAVPTMFALELNHPDRDTYDLASLRTGIIAGAPAGSEMVRRIREEMGCNICHAYGLTETSSLCTITRLTESDELRNETCGRAYPGIGVAIIDEAGNALGPGEVGEVAIDGPGVMKGYYRMPQETAQAFTANGWLRTGDLGTLDDLGYLRILGRKKEMIIRGGFNVYPREIEDLLAGHEKVLLVAVIGYPDDVLGERICAVVQVKPGTSATEEEITTYCRGRLADFKAPDKVVFTDGFPMTVSGKIQKTALRRDLVKTLERTATP